MVINCWLALKGLSELIINMERDMTITNSTHKRWVLIEEIKTKAHQLDSISIIAQGSDLDGLNSEVTENLFGLMSNLSKDILVLADDSFNTEKSHA
jgi:hypothetical protein